MTGRVTLRDLEGTYKRVTSRIYRLLEDGYDFAVEEQIIAILDMDARIVDAAFFVLIFGQIENRLNELALRRLRTERERNAIREARFQRRLETALPGADNKDLRKTISGWYDLRSDAAHGERLHERYNVAAVFERAFELDALVSAQFNRSESQGEESQ